MRTASADLLPPPVRNSLRKLGSDLAIARRKRAFTVATMAERTGVAKNTYLKLEKGDPSVSLGAYAMALFVLGFENALSQLADVRTDDTGLLLDNERLPKRVRAKKNAKAL
jgi:transcriptional regulator with XRE-family HTH domain